MIKPRRKTSILVIIFLCLFSVDLRCGRLFAQQEKQEPIIVNGDTVEYLTEGKEVVATGNVSVIYKGSKLTCNKLTVNTQTKEGLAEGDVRLEDGQAVVEGDRIKYNFQTKQGMIMDSEFRSNPYFGKAEQVEKVSDGQFIARRGYMTTCDFDDPHYRLRSNFMNIFPDDKVQTRQDSLYIGKIPVMYVPQYNHSMKDPLMHVQFMPGKSKDWGIFGLSAWRYNITDDIKGRIFLDYRSKKGFAEGFGTNYSTVDFGKGDFKFYYTQERDHSLSEDDDLPREFQRYFIRWRHKGDIDDRTNLTAEYYEINDSKMGIYGDEYNFMKDYFFREYEKDSQPPTYLLFHHAFDYSSMDFFLQKRTNRWYNRGYLERLPEVRYTLPSFELGRSYLYLENNSIIGNYNKKNTSTLTPAENEDTPDTHVNRLDTSNKLSYPMKVSFIKLTPFVMNRETFYSRRAYGSTFAPRTVFYAGSDASTKFFRIFNVKTNALGLNLNGLRHIITPTISHSFNHEPSVQSSELRQIDAVDTITRNNTSTLTLTNKLQTKRNNTSVDIVDLNLSTDYSFKPKSGERGSSLSDLLIELQLLPYSWLTVVADATYDHSGPRNDPLYNHFSTANYSFNFNFGKERTFAFGQRYLLKGGNELTFDLAWRLNPKWKVGVYERFNRGHDPALKRGLREQEYTLTRDLHCWTWDVTYNVRRGHGETIWFVFRLKAFPELEFEFNQGYHEPKPGSQSNP